MITAKQARDFVTTKVEGQQRAILSRLHTQLCEEIKRAVNNGLIQATVTLPTDMDSDVANALKNVLIKLGYSVQLDHVLGSFERDVYIAPRSVITVRW